MNRKTDKTDFTQGAVWKNIMTQAVPLTIAQLVHLLYNIVDRIYIGHMGDGHSLALTGVGLTFPIVTLIMAFTVLFGNGGLPLFSMARGAGDSEKAADIMGNSLALLLAGSVALTAAGYIFCRPILFAFGAGEASYVYAKAYLDVYLTGTLFSMVGFCIIGFGVSNLIPILFSCISRQKAVPVSQAISTVTTLGYLGLMAGPPAMGYIAHQYGLYAVFGSVAVLVLLASVSAWKALR